MVSEPDWHNNPYDWIGTDGRAIERGPQMASSAVLNIYNVTAIFARPRDATLDEREIVIESKGADPIVLRLHSESWDALDIKPHPNGLSAGHK